MKKTLTLLVAVTMASATVRAEAELAESTEASTTEYRDLSTDQATLEAHKALLAAPKNKDGEKDLNYWAGTVGSRIKVTGYAQGGYTADFEEHGDNSNTFQFERAILMVGAEITPKFYGYFMHSFKNGSVQEYYMEYRPCKAFNVRLGQSKKQLSIENPLSPTVLENSGMSQGVDYLLGNDYLLGDASGRDNGLMIYGDFAKNHFRYYLEIVNGQKLNTSDADNKKNIIAKLEYLPVPNLKIVVSGQKGYGTALATSPFAPDIEVGEVYKRDRYTIGFDWKASPTGTDYFKNRCFSLRGEFLGGRNKNSHSYGGYLTTAIPVYKELDVVASVDYFNYSTDLGAKSTYLMTGVQYWLATKCRLMFQYQYSARSEAMKAIKGGNTHTLFTRVQVAF